MTAEPASLEAGQEHISSRIARYLLFDRVNRDYLRWQVAQFEPYIGQRVLEVGVGIGTIVELLGERELIHGLDVENEVLDYTRARFASNPAIDFDLLDINGVTGETLERLRGKRFDTVVCINVLEHIEDHVNALQTMERLLEPGGHLCLLVPAHMTLYGEYDALDGHFRRYNRRLLRATLAQTGLEVRDLYHLNAVGAAGWWAQYKLLRRKIHGGSQFSIMNRLLPAVQAVERRVRPPFGLSVIAVARKPGP